MAKKKSALPATTEPIDPLQKQIDEQRKEIHTDGYPMSIGEITSLYESGDIDIHPEFQRFFRWSASQKARWIESILIGIPLPSIFVSQAGDGTWDVIDGLQRLSTIFEFMGILKDEDGKKLPPLVLKPATYLTELAGKRWTDASTPSKAITIEQQRYIKRGKLDIKIIQRESDASAQYEMFQRLNTGGATLTQQELRNCILISINRDYYKWLVSLAKYPNFKLCTAIPEKMVKLSYDVELVLRFILLRTIGLDDLPGWGEGLGDFLTKRMITIATKRQFNIAKEEKAFKATFDLLASSLGADSFKKYDSTKERFSGAFSVAVFEVVALGLGFDIENAKKKSPKEIGELIKTKAWADTSFLTSTGLAASTRIPVTLKRGRSVFAQ